MGCVCGRGFLRLMGGGFLRGFLGLVGLFWGFLGFFRGLCFMGMCFWGFFFMGGFFCGLFMGGGFLWCFLFFGMRGLFWLEVYWSDMIVV